MFHSITPKITAETNGQVNHNKLKTVRFESKYRKCEINCTMIIVPVIIKLIPTKFIKFHDKHILYHEIGN